MTSGGKRKGAGRKKLADPKGKLVLFILKSRINTVGKDKCREIAIEGIEFEYQRIR